MPKYHVGQLMEVISFRYIREFLGERFNIVEVGENVVYGDGRVAAVAYNSGLVTSDHLEYWPQEYQIKPVDLDDEADDTTFEEFMDEISKDLVVVSPENN